MKAAANQDFDDWSISETCPHIKGAENRDCFEIWEPNI